MSSRTLSVIGSASATSVTSSSDANVNSVMERDEAGDSKINTLRGLVGLRSAGHLFAGTVNKTASFTIDTTGTLYNCDATSGAITAGLSAAATYSGQLVAVVKTDTSTNAVTIDGNGSEIVGVGTTFKLNYYGDAVLLECDGTGWAVVATSLGIPFRVNCPLNADNVDQAFFVVDRAYQLVAAYEIHATAGTDGSAVNVQIVKDTGTNAPGAGTDLLTNNTNAGFNLKGTINTLQTGTLTSTVADLQLAAGDRLSLDYAGVTTSLAGVSFTIVLRPI